MLWPELHTDCFRGDGDGDEAHTGRLDRDMGMVLFSRAPGPFPGTIVAFALCADGHCAVAGILCFPCAQHCRDGLASIPPRERGGRAREAGEGASLPGNAAVGTGSLAPDPARSGFCHCPVSPT